MRMRALYFMAILVLVNCKEPIDLKVNGAIGVVVIDGQITTQPGPYELRLGLTVGTTQKPNPIEGARALIIDHEVGSEEYTEVQPGIYSITGDNIKGMAGHTYHVEVVLPDGRTYATRPETIPSAAVVDTPYWELGQRSEFVNETEVKINVLNVFVDTQLPSNEKNYYVRWNTDEVYMFEQTPVADIMGRWPSPCYVSGDPDPQRITLYSSKDQDLDKLTHTLVAARDIDQSFLSRHAFTVYARSITKESYNYWRQVNQQVNRSGSIFDTPPAPILGNAFSKTDENETVYGYFEASNTTLTRFYMLRAELKVNIPPYCNDGSRGLYWPDYPRECKACLLLPNSSNVPPSWWFL